MKKAFSVSFAALAVLAAPAFSEELTGTLQKIRDSGVITIGYRETSMPFSYVDDAQKPIGFALDICYTIVDEVKATLKLDKLKIELTPVSSSTRIPLIGNGTIDLECASTTNNLEREKLVAFTHTYFLTANRFVAKTSSGLKTIDDLKGKTVASTSGTSNIKELADANTSRNLGMTILTSKDIAEGFLLVETDRADAFVMDDILLAGLIASSQAPGDWRIIDDALRTEPYGLIIRKDDPEFKALVDKTLVAMMKSGQFAELYAKWFTKPIPPRNVNLNFSMPAPLKDAVATPNDKGV